MPRRPARFSKRPERIRSFGPRVLGLLLTLVTLLVAGNAWAQRVLLVRPKAPDSLLREAFNRLRAELLLQDFDVVVKDAGEDTGSPQTIALAAERAGAFAGISLTLEAGTRSANVWLADRVTGKTTMRSFALSRTEDAPSVLAVRAVDLLRSSLREFGPDGAPPADVTGVDRQPVPVEVRAFSAPAPAAFGLSIGAAALAEVSDLGAAYGPTAAFEHRVTPRVGLALVIAGPLLGASFGARGGQAFLRQELAAVEGRLTAWHVPPLDLGFTLGLGVYHLNARSEVDPPLVAQSDQVTSALGSAGLELEARVTDSVGATASASAIGLLPRPGVAVEDDRLLFKLPLVRATLALLVDF